MDRATYLRIGGTILVGMCFGGAAMAQVAPGTPTPIPDGAVMTPRGLMDKACVHALPMGGRPDSNGDVFVGNVKVAHHDPCTPAQANRFAGITSPPAIGHAWVEYTNAWANDINGVELFNELDETFQVPPNPTTFCVQLSRTTTVCPLLYLFPSFENSAGTEIIQPVLSWGDNGDYGGQQWMMSSWYATSLSGDNYYSPPIWVQPGDSLEGYMYMYDATHYQIQTIDWTKGVYTYLNFAPVNAMTTVQSGVLEVYGLWTCNQLPPSDSIIFNISSISQAGPAWSDMNYVTPTFGANVASTSPSCGWAVSVSQSPNPYATLRWHN